MRKLFLIFIVLAMVWAWLQQPDTRYTEQLSTVVGPNPRLSGLGLDQDPRQIMLTPEPTLTIDAFDIQLRAEFGLVARVLSRKDYRRDHWADLAPLDLALGWGPMGDANVVSEIDIQQRGRWYYWQVDEFPIPRQQIERHSANMHIIPASPALLQQLDQIEPGDSVRLTGYLVDVDHENGANWRTSLRRDDTGNGACELFMVTSLTLF
ncbi:MAG: hypothetical protein AAGH65_02300 [Pseudomonadota bacterium]